MSQPEALRSAGPGSCAILALTLLAAACDAPIPSTTMPRDSIIARLADLRAIHTPEGVEALEPIEVNDPVMAWAERHLIDGAPEPRRSGMVECFEVPVIMLHGRFDLHTPYESALDYFNRIDAPHKQFVTFERSSHMIMFEEPGRILMTLVNEVLPLAAGRQESAGP